MLAASVRLDAELYSDEPGALSVLVWAARIEDLRRGLYVYEPTGPALGLLGEDTWAPGELFLQEEFAHAAGVVVTVVDLAALLCRYGAHGYRLALTRGGAAAHMAWLVSLTAGLEGSLFAGFIPAALQRFVPVDGLTRLACLAYAFGHPGDPGGPGAATGG